MSTLRELRERSREEKNAIAAWVALAVVAVLFIAWLIYFFQEVAATSAGMQSEQPATTSTASSDLGQQALGQLSATTSAYIQLEEISATSTGPGM